MDEGGGEVVGAFGVERNMVVPDVSVVEADVVEVEVDVDVDDGHRSSAYGSHVYVR